MKIHNKTLRKVPFFCALPVHDLSALAKICRLQHFDPRQQIVAQNARSRNIHFILSGKVRIAYHTLNEREVIICEHSEGDMFGVLSLMNGKL